MQLWKICIKAGTLAVLAHLAACNANGDGSAGSPIANGSAGTGGADVGGYKCIATAPPGSVSTVSETGLLCTLTDPLNAILDTCSIQNPVAAIDGNFNSFATAQYAVGALDPALGGSVTLTVDLPGPVAAGQVAAFAVDFPAATLVNISLLRDLTVSTALNGTAQEAHGANNAAQLDLLGTNIAGSPGRILVGFANSKPYNQLSLTVSAQLLSADLMNAVNIHEACIAATP